jgi:hypothetical protein
MTDSAVAFFRATDRRFFVTAFLAATLLLREAAVLFAVDRLIAILPSISHEMHPIANQRSAQIENELATIE